VGDRIILLHFGINTFISSTTTEIIYSVVPALGQVFSILGPELVMIHIFSDLDDNKIIQY
jgi:hypothetical protein